MCQSLEAFGLVGPFDYLDGYEPIWLSGPFSFSPSQPPSPKTWQSGIVVTERVQHRWRAVAVLDISAVYLKAAHQTKRVGQDVTLAVLDLLSGIDAADGTVLGGLDALPR